MDAKKKEEIKQVLEDSPHFGNVRCGEAEIDNEHYRVRVPFITATPPFQGTRRDKARVAPLNSTLGIMSGALRLAEGGNMRFVILLVVMLTFSAQAQVERRDHAISASGLSVAFPSDHSCEPISSPFSSSSRHDGSLRRGDRNGGLHGGIDLSLTAGTPLLAIADGEVIALGEGGALEGIYIWLRHTPKDTDSPYFVFSKYQHLSALPTLKVGDHVMAGKVVGLSGATGTAGKHYGSTGYAHLHLSTFYGSSDEYEIKGMYGSIVSGKDARLDDPLILYLEGLQDISTVRSLPDERKTVRPGVVGDDGVIHPKGRKTVWPVACRVLTKH